VPERLRSKERDRAALNSENSAMMRHLIAGLALGVIMAAKAVSAAENASLNTPGVTDEQHPVYVQIIVKACPQTEALLEATNQGKVYDEEKPMTLEERKAALVAQGCIDVPYPWSG
jgi:hypothetical protein